MIFLLKTNYINMYILQNKQELFNPIKDYWATLGCKDISLYDETNKILSENKLINQYNNI